MASTDCPDDNYIILVYWKGRDDWRPKDYRSTLPSGRKKIEDSNIYRYTNLDGYLAQLLWQLIVQGH